MDKLTIWVAIFIILLIIILPTTYAIFSLCWLLTGDMVSRLIFFTTSGVLTTLTTLLLFVISFYSKIDYRNKMNPIKFVKTLKERTKLINPTLIKKLSKR